MASDGRDFDQVISSLSQSPRPVLLAFERLAPLIEGEVAPKAYTQPPPPDIVITGQGKADGHVVRNCLSMVASSKLF